ncbi:MAG TPA: S8 family serine peptidase [Xanthobacteraceae bacterium]
MRNVFSTESLPSYHENLLIVSVRKEALSSAPTGGPLGQGQSAMMAAVSPATTGLGALAFYERAGMVKRVVPLRKEDPREQPRTPSASVLSALFFSAAAPRKNDPNHGVSIVEIEHGHDTTPLRTALANDPNIVAVAKVPIRYLAARRTAPRRSSVASRVARPRASSKPAATISTVPPPASAMWNLDRIRWAQARAQSGFRDAVQISVAVLDSGVDFDHPDLKGQILGYHWNYPDLSRPASSQDLIGHGTHVSGSIGAIINNDVGINGICKCNLSVWKIFDDEPTYASGSGAFVYYVNPIMYRRALADCVQTPVDVMNLSIGGPGEPDAQEKWLFEQLLSAGTIICAAMGNERQYGSPTSYPGAIPGVVAVGATSLDDTVAVFSNRGNHIAVSAPGKAIWSTLPTYAGQTGFYATIGSDGSPRQGKPVRRETDYDAWDGTSMATPHVTGAAALMVANKGKLTPSKARDRLMQTADKVAEMKDAKFSPDYGAGRLNLAKLLA